MKQDLSSQHDVNITYQTHAIEIKIEAIWKLSQTWKIESMGDILGAISEPELVENSPEGIALTKKQIGSPVNIE